MKREWDLVREILLRLESAEPGSMVMGTEFGPDYDDQMVSYHMAMMKDAGLIEARVMVGNAMYMNGIAMALKWAGHEFLDGIRKKEAWEKVKSTAKSKGLDLTFDVIKAVTKLLVEAAFRNAT